MTTNLNTTGSIQVLLAYRQTHLLVTHIFVVEVLSEPLDTSCRQYA